MLFNADAGFRSGPRPGFSAASRRSISASMRCSSIDSAIAPPPRRAPVGYPLDCPPAQDLYPIVPGLPCLVFPDLPGRLGCAAGRPCVRLTAAPAYRVHGCTSVSNRVSRVRRPGSAVRPVCTGPGLGRPCLAAGRSSQRNRSPSGRPASGPSVQALVNAPSAAPDRTGVHAGVERPQPVLVELDPGAQVAVLLGVHDDPGVDRLTALDPGHQPDQRVLPTSKIPPIIMGA